MRQVLARTEVPPLVWIDLTDPSRDEIQQISAEHRLPAHLLADCLEPGHLPKVEQAPGLTFVMVRAYDEASGPDGDTAQEMTRKVAVFAGQGVLVTVHRTDQPWLLGVRDALRRDSLLSSSAAAMAAIVTHVISSYAPPLEAAENDAGTLEEKVLEQRDVAAALRHSSHLKRRVGVMRWMLRRTMDVTVILKTAPDAAVTHLQEARERAERLYLVADDLVDDVNNLITLQLALASHQTNEVVRLLTVFSAFFLPLTFIVGVYGMNFEHMPELRHTWGYPAVWAVMGATVAGIFAWFRSKGWLR